MQQWFGWIGGATIDPGSHPSRALQAVAMGELKRDVDLLEMQAP